MRVKVNNYSSPPCTLSIKKPTLRPTRIMPNTNTAVEKISPPMCNYLLFYREYL
ncbi:hypothetical protein S7335_4700 [Synechococcus sp. PCC 7335]|nr:hypothetical protein S7335_4700 [Synechococcus sp. PCC 7335]